MILSRLRLESAVLLLGAAVLVAWSYARLPAPRGIFRLATPFDRTESRTTAGPAFRFLSLAAMSVPAGATAVMLTEPRDAGRESSLHGAAVALLPGRRVLPGAEWGLFEPEYEAQADYILVLGPAPLRPPGTLLFRGAGGSVWKRRRP